MTILLINWQDRTNPYAGGAEIHLHEIFSRVARKGHRVVLLCCSYPGAPGEEVLNDGILAIRWGNRATFNFHVPSAYRTLRHRFKPDLVIDDLNKIPFWTPLYVKEPLLCISHHFFGQSIFREVDPVRGLYVYCTEHLVPLVYRNTHIAVVSESTRREFLQYGWSDDKITVVYNGIDQSRFPMAVGQKAPFPMITYLGRIKRYKCPDHLLYAFVSVKEHYPNARLYFIGDGDYMRSLQRLASHLGISEHTVWTGWVTEEEKISLLSKSWCVVNTSMKEGWGITCIEANACGTLVIAANVPGLRDSVRDGLSGLLYRFGNIEQLSSSIAKVIDDERLRYSLSNGAVEWARRFSWEDSASAMHQLCEKIASVSR